MSSFRGAIDFHSHILPSIDHGCKDIDECRGQLALMSESGTSLAVATPHFYPHEHKVSDFISNVSYAVSLMHAAKIENSPCIALGAEVLLCHNLHKMEGLEKLYIRGTNILLLELPMNRLSDAYLDTVEAIMENGTTVVLAHIDRYLRDYEETIDTLLSMGAYAQINAHSLSSGKIRRKLVSYLEQSDKICAVGSDLHGVDKTAYKKFVKAGKLLGEYYPTIMKRSEKLLQDAEIINI